MAKIKLTQADGNPTLLVERGSQMVLEEVAPYRVAVTEFAEAIDGDSAALARARGVATRALARPLVATGGTERFMLRNLLGLCALLDGDMAMPVIYERALSDAEIARLLALRLVNIRIR